MFDISIIYSLTPGVIVRFELHSIYMSHQTKGLDLEQHNILLSIQKKSSNSMILQRKRSKSGKNSINFQNYFLEKNSIKCIFNSEKLD